MFCQNCGKEISNQADVCPHCGKFVNKGKKDKKISKILDILSFVFLGGTVFYTIIYLIAAFNAASLWMFLFSGASLGCVIASVVIKKKDMDKLKEEIENRNIKQSNNSDK